MTEEPVRGAKTMANEKKTSRKKFRVAVSGSTVDGREISPVHLREAAENFNPDVYAARVNVEHYLSPCPSSEFSAMGDVTALSTEDITEGPLAGRTALYAEIEPTERMKQLVADGKKIYSSIELHPQFSVNGRAYLVGLAMTDTPASLGTERLKFTAQQRQAVMTFNSVQGEAPLISEAIESEIIEMAEQRQEEGTQWFNRVMGIIGRGRKADDASFSRIQEAVEGVATSQADIIDRFNALETRHQQDSQKITLLTTELTALKEKLRTQDGDPQNRFTATGAASDQLADF
ncbi:phage capsid scaffolding protein GpO [Escherichia coli 907391]|nr:phage capsid scaffolding protein GpO [Escherichia coli 907391]OSK90141.1 phage capsid scaffolding protein GpO [Escherichia coli H378]